MLRASPASSMQKTYDDCYLICSTAIYFEKHNNEDEALRSWREALDQIYYHNAYRVPANYRPKTETEKALQSSLREMELQCKERVDLLDALRTSRKEAQAEASSIANGSSYEQRPLPLHSNGMQQQTDTLGDGTIPVANYPDLARPPVPQKPPPYSFSQQNYPRRPSNPQSGPSDEFRQQSISAPPKPSEPPKPSAPPNIPNLAAQPKKPSRTPSPDRRSGRLRPTLRNQERRTVKGVSTAKNRPPAAAQAATLAWPNGYPPNLGLSHGNGSATSLPGAYSAAPRKTSAESGALDPSGGIYHTRSQNNDYLQPPSPVDFMPEHTERRSEDMVRTTSGDSLQKQLSGGTRGVSDFTESSGISRRKGPPPPPPRRQRSLEEDKVPTMGNSTKTPPPPPDFPVYRKEYPTPTPIDPRKAQSIAARRNAKPNTNPLEDNDHKSSGPLTAQSPSQIHRKAVPSKAKAAGDTSVAAAADISNSSSSEVENNSRRKPKKIGESPEKIKVPSEPLLEDEEVKDEEPDETTTWDDRVARLMKNLPKGVDEQAAKSIFNEIVIKGDEVHWDDVAGLEVAKNALKEAVVYPFLRPDLFMGLREPARGMLLFGPPGTGKTMLARAVATESKSTFFAISASSLTSKYLGESEKLVRALFSIAKSLTPAIIFVDEIDSLLSARAGSGEHEATRRIKTEFLIQWSDLAKAAAGRESSDKEGDASRVLVLAATNMPWAIDDAARRRFVRRQYIPLPEDHVREEQIRRLLSAQKHSLNDEDLDHLVEVTDGFSGSDITALAKDAAMGPLRSLGERLLHMSPEDIRPIMFEDFEASLVNIRPSVSKQGLKEFEDWAKEYGERAG